MQRIQIMLGWATAVVTTVVLGSVAQTLFNLQSIAELGETIGWGLRVKAIGHDLLSFTPTYAILISLAFAIAWPVAGALKRFLPEHRGLLFTLAGFSAVWVMIAIMNEALPVTLIGATRELDGTLALAAIGGLAGWLYTRLIRLPET